MKKRNVISLVKSFRNKPKLYHHICFGVSGIVVVFENYSEKVTAICPYYAVDRSCAAGKSCLRKGKVKGFKQLTPIESVENRLLDKMEETVGKL